MDTYENFRKKNLKDMFKSFIKIGLICSILQGILVIALFFIPEKINFWDFGHFIFWSLFTTFSFYKYKKIKTDDTNE